MRKPKDTFARQLIRMSWSKYNLYTIATRGKQAPRLGNRTLYQQKWIAKRETRAYHGGQVNERQFLRLFIPKIPTSNTRVAGQEKDKKHPPAVVLTYASLERRLDTIVFRACLATSIWQARQMVLHGKVSVNGVKTPKPAYHASPGDIISVVPRAIPLLSEPATESGLTFVRRPFMQPFIFIPDYLEVNFNTCSIVYLRHPISRPGLSEIPSPFPPDLHALAYELYVSRKKKRTSRQQLKPEKFV